jgi:hypothetical protein
MAEQQAAKAAEAAKEDELTKEAMQQVTEGPTGSVAQAEAEDAKEDAAAQLLVMRESKAVGREGKL